MRVSLTLGLDPRLDYFGRINDYQTATMIICVLSERIRRDFEAIRSEQQRRSYQLASGSLKRQPKKFIQHTRSNSNAENMGGVCAASGGVAGGNSGTILPVATPNRENYRKLEENLKGVLIHQQPTASIDKEQYDF
ncbi:unnamed protein product [Anisakis simplex]|uniref:Uncharacterized protein n=1 Tax=Anisakis simplex TaxID=6269 RepID=A0A0M3KGM6_ANISI|nr:unnamed protein product [Anisakis simplex]